MSKGGRDWVWVTLILMKNSHFDGSVRFHIKFQKIDGNRFLALAKEDIMKLVNNKIGPCLKIENLQRLLKARMNPAQARFQATMTRKSS